MALTTFSKFYYGYTFDTTNNIINFDEGGGELSAEISPGSFTLNNTLINIKTALDAAGANTYTVSVDRDTRRITIAADANFDLLINTGTQSSLGPWGVLGFDTSSDRTGTDTYTGESASGSVYYPQFRLQDYVPQGNAKERIDATINESASGNIETVFYGVREFVEFSLKFITDKAIGCDPFFENPNGLADAIDFLDYLSTKGGFEFMPDKGSSGDFISLRVESMPGSSQGVGFELTELFNRGLPDIYEINSIRCRVI